MDWIESAPGPFEAASMFDLWEKAFADFSGKDGDGFDMWFMCSINKLGFYERRTSSGGWVLEVTP